MGILKNPMVGIPSGRAGEFVIRTRYGKQVLYSKPKKYKPTKSVKLEEIRGRFKITVNLAKAIKQSELLNSTWKNSPIEGKNAYTKILKRNINTSDPGLLTEFNRITPEPCSPALYGVNTDFNKLTLNKKGLAVDFTFDNRVRKGIETFSFSLFLLIYCYNPVIKSKNPNYDLILTEYLLGKLERGINKKILFDNNIIKRKHISNFKDAIAYVALAAPVILPHGPGQKHLNLN